MFIWTILHTTMNPNASWGAMINLRGHKMVKEWWKMIRGKLCIYSWYQKCFFHILSTFFLKSEKFLFSLSAGPNSGVFKKTPKAGMWWDGLLHLEPSSTFDIPNLFAFLMWRMRQMANLLLIHHLALERERWWWWWWWWWFLPFFLFTSGVTSFLHILFQTSSLFHFGSFAII